MNLLEIIVNMNIWIFYNSAFRFLMDAAVRAASASSLLYWLQKTVPDIWRMDGEDVMPRNVARHIVFSIFWNFP